MILSHALWEGRFGADPGLVGRAIRVNGRELVVVGILPRGFRFPDRQELYVPWRAAADARRDQRFLSAFALLREGSTDAQAGAQLAALGERLARLFSDSHRQWAFASLEVRELLVGKDARVLHGVGPRGRHARRQTAQQRQRAHVDGDSPVGVRSLQRDAHQPVRQHEQALLRDRGTQHVAQQRLAALRVEAPARVAACNVNPSSEAHRGLS